MSELGIIGGTGLTHMEQLEIVRREVVHTPFGEPSAPFVHGRLYGKEVVFLARHGPGHTIPPHKINYRANIWAMDYIGVKRIIAVAAVGGIRADMVPARLAIPDQIIDYTWGRANTFFEDGEKVVHVDFTHPYCPELREKLIQAARQMAFDVAENGCYAATQGPRLETAAEVDRLERDGADLVGMTGMPEAVLARELDISYATIAVVANRAAGRDSAPLTMDEIGKNLKTGMARVRDLLEAAIPLI